MKTRIFMLLLAASVSGQMFAQDDMYFVPAKKEKAKVVSSDVPFAGKTYYSGINKSDDEYNRRVHVVHDGVYELNADDLYSADSIASDVIYFTPDKNEDFAESSKRDTVYILVAEENDYSLCRRMSRFEEFYWDRYFYGPYWSHRWMWTHYDPWYDPFYSFWYDPFFDPWMSPWYSSYYYGRYPYYAFGYDPYYHHYGYPYGMGYTVSHRPHTAYAPGKHAGFGGHGGVIVNKTAGTSSNNLIARRNGDAVRRSSDVRSRGNFMNRGDYTVNNHSAPRTEYGSGSSSRSYSGGGGYSRSSGGSSSGGGGSRGGGGGGGISYGRR